MKKVALIQLPHFYGEGFSRPPECYPLGLGYISSMLIKDGIPHEGVDLWGNNYSVDQALEKVDFSKFDLLGISAYVTQYNYLKDFSLKLKKRYPEIPIICGGPAATFSAEIILKHTGVDVCVIGEGDITITELIRNFDRLESVAGIAYRKEGNIYYTPGRPYVANLDDLPFCNRELFDFEKIMSTANAVQAEKNMPELRRRPRRSADIIAGRGCPYSCNFCSKTFRGCRLRSIDNLVAEIAHLKEKYRINHLLFNDELVLVNKKRTLELCGRIKELNMLWSCQGRIDQVDREILIKMKDAGCIEVGYGVESISQNILDNMNKKLKASTIVDTIKMTKEIGLKPIVQYMYGYPGENDETLKATVNFFKEINHYFVGFTTTPLPGSQLYEDCLSRGIIADEEEYLRRLDSGYNLSGSLINLTDFTDKEFFRKKKLLQLKITHNYLKKRPIDYAAFFLGLAFRKSIRFVKRMFR